MWSKIILISLLALNLEAGIISKTVKKVVVSKAKNVIVDKTKVAFKEKVLNNPNVKNKVNSTFTKLQAKKQIEKDSNEK